MPRWTAQDDAAILAAAAARTGSGWPETIDLPDRGRITGKQASMRFARIQARRVEREEPVQRAEDADDDIEPRHRRRLTPMRERAEKVGIPHVPTPQELRDVVADPDVSSAKKRKAKLQIHAHQKARQARVKRAETRAEKLARFREMQEALEYKWDHLNKRHVMKDLFWIRQEVADLEGEMVRVAEEEEENARIAALPPEMQERIRFIKWVQPRKQKWRRIRDQLQQRRLKREVLRKQEQVSRMCCYHIRYDLCKGQSMWSHSQKKFISSREIVVGPGGTERRPYWPREGPIKDWADDFVAEYERRQREFRERWCGPPFGQPYQPEKYLEWCRSQPPSLY